MHVMTENEIRNVASRIEAGGTFTVPPDTILTPLARDYLHGRGIHVADSSGQKSAARTTTVTSSSDDALVSAVADEVSRILREQQGASGKPSSTPAASGDPAAALARKSGSDGSQRAVVWAIGGDRPGILADVAELLSRNNANILEINQTILSGVFAMVVIVDLSQVKLGFADFKAELEALGKKLGVNLSAQRDEIFQYMHRV